MPIQQYLLPHRIQENLSCCPTSVATYATFHLDSIAKILNHLLAGMLVCNVLLFFSSLNVSFLPSVGFSTFLVSCCLCFQNVCVAIILNNNRFSSFAFLAPTEFMLGVALGITIGGTILAFVISMSFRTVSQCHQSEIDPVYEYLCGDRRGSMVSVWFWSGLVFWLNFCCTLLLAIGRRELSASSQYEAIGGDDSFDHLRIIGHGNNGGMPANLSTPTPSFVGDYANVPEIRPEQERQRLPSSSDSVSSMETARITAV